MPRVKAMSIEKDDLKILKDETLKIKKNLKNILKGQKAWINKEKLKKILEEQENLINNFNQRIDGIIGQGGDEEESGSPPPSKRPHLEKETKEEKDGLIRDESSFVQVWVSGYLNPPYPMCRSKRKRYGYNEYEKEKEAGFGIFWAKNHPLNKSLPYSSAHEHDPEWTNEVEVEAVTNTIKLARKNKIKKLKIHTDSDHMFNVAMEKLSRWKRNDWKTSQGEAVGNAASLKALDYQIQNSGIKIIWKREHGSTQSVKCDKCEEYRSEGSEMAEAAQLASQGSDTVRYTNGGEYYQQEFEYDSDETNDE